MKCLFQEILVAVMVIGAVSGCGPRSPKAEGVVPVAGVVTSGGKPVAGATVTFYPDSPDGRAAAGTTDAQGKFRLTTLSADDGAKPGTYKVMVSKIEVTGVGATMSQDEQYKYLEQHGSPPPAESKNVLPELYANLTSTPLTATVKDGGNDFQFDLNGGTGAVSTP